MTIKTKLAPNKLYILFIPIITILIALLFSLNKSKSVHHHAGFTVYTNGVKQDFSDTRYMNFTACTEHNTDKSREEEQLEKAHLHDNVGDVVHIHRTGGTWRDLFKNIQYEIPKNIAVVGYKDGQKVDNILNQKIVGNESVMIVIGDASAVDQSAYVPLERIREIEAKSELCGS